MHVSQDQLFMMNVRVQNQCCQFFKILIKKKSSCFLQRVVGLLCHAGGAFLFTIGKKLSTILKKKKKIKTKKLKRLCTIPKVKTKKLQMKVFQFHT